MNKSEKTELLSLLPYDIQTTKEFTPSLKLVLAYFIQMNGLDKSKENGQFFITNDALVTELQISSKTLVIVVNKLTELNFISRKSGKRKHASEYILNLETINSYKNSGKNTVSVSTDKGNGNVNKILNKLIKKIDELSTRINDLEAVIKENTVSISNNNKETEMTDTESDSELEKDSNILNKKDISNNINNKNISNNSNINNILKEEKESVQVEDKLKINKNKIEIDSNKFENSFIKLIKKLKETLTISELNTKYEQSKEWLHKKKQQYPSLNVEEKLIELTNSFNTIKNKLIKESYNTSNKPFLGSLSNDKSTSNTITLNTNESSTESLKIREKEHMHKVHNNRLDKAINDMEEILTIGTRYNTTQEYNINEANAIIDNIKDMSEYYKELPDIKEKFSRLFEIYNKIVIPITV